MLWNYPGLIKILSLFSVKKLLLLSDFPDWCIDFFNQLEILYRFWLRRKYKKHFYLKFCDSPILIHSAKLALQTCQFFPCSNSSFRTTKLVTFSFELFDNELLNFVRYIMISCCFKILRTSTDFYT